MRVPNEAAFAGLAFAGIVAGIVLLVRGMLAYRSAGRISGAKSIPISELKVGGFHTVSERRLQVNQSAERYQRQLKYLASMI